MFRIVFVLTVCVIVLTLPFADRAEQATPATKDAAPCSSPTHGQFDFWLGEWVVYADGKRVGTNRIEKRYGGCVLVEHWEGASGSRGTSINAYDAARDKWHQTWADNRGTLLQLDGGWTGEAMVLSGVRDQGKGGAQREHRITWTPDDDGSVRQHWQARKPGAAWQTLFDGHYRRPDAGD